MSQKFGRVNFLTNFKSETELLQEMLEPSAGLIRTDYFLIYVGTNLQLSGSWFPGEIFCFVKFLWIQLKDSLLSFV